MKRSFLDFFKREYQVDLTVSSHDTVAPQAAQWKGAALLAPDGNEIFRDGNEAGIEECFSRLRDFHPQVLRIDAASPDLDSWLKFCLSENIFPHIVFAAGADPEQIRTIVSECRSRFSENDMWDPKRFYEIDHDLSHAAAEGEDSVIAMAAELKEKAEMVRSLDPDGMLILSGSFPGGDDRAKAAFINRVLLEQCASVMDLIGVRVFPSVLSGRSWDEDSEGIEANIALAEKIRQGLRELDREIMEYAPGTDIRIAVTGWGSLQDGCPQKRQDCVFYSSVYSMIRMAADSVALSEAGPLFGSGGLLTEEDGHVRMNVFGLVLQAAAYDLPICLRVKEAERENAVPAFHWEGLPGVFDGAEMKLMEVIASRSPDGKRLFLFVTNRSAFKSAVPRIRFLNMPDMHPIKACIIRSDNRLDENSAAEPGKVFCKELKLRNYRKMNHVTLEIPACSSACMVLGD